jgi:hypothetical protein
MSTEKLSSVDWPPALVKELADRRVVVVIGSGLSATAAAESNPELHPPTWRDLLTKLAAGASLTPEVQADVDSLIESRKYPEAAQEIMDKADPPSLALALRSILMDPRFKASAAHRDLLAIDSPITVNLNYDRIYENQCLLYDASSYVVTHYYNEDFVRNIRSPLRIILKLHGSVDDPQKIVFSRSSYTKAQQEYPNIFAVLRALLITRTVFFLGCGFNGDPDVELLLTESALKQPGAYPHYALVPTRQEHAAFSRAVSEGMNLKFIEYSVLDGDGGLPDHSEFARALADLKDLVLESRATGI